VVSILHHVNGEIKKLSIKEFSQVFRQPEGVLWVDLEDPSDAEEETLLVSLLDIHPLAIEDAQHGKEDEGHLPKVEDFGDYLFIIFNPIERKDGHAERSAEKLDIRTSQLSAFLFKGVLVTHHYKPLRSIAYAAQMCGKNPQMLGRGPDFLFHLVIDDIVDNYTPILDAMDEAIDSMEDEVFERPTQRCMVRILQLKKDIMTIRRRGL